MVNNSSPFLGAVVAAALHLFIEFVEYDTARRMMRWSEETENQVDEESGRPSVRSHDSVRPGAERGGRSASVAKEAGRETVSNI
jgi:hypothetical protein